MIGQAGLEEDGEKCVKLQDASLTYLQSAEQCK